jgi:hypothetical protein
MAGFSLFVYFHYYMAGIVVVNIFKNNFWSEPFGYDIIMLRL